MNTKFIKTYIIYKGSKIVRGYEIPGDLVNDSFVTTRTVAFTDDDLIGVHHWPASSATDYNFPERRRIARYQFKLPAKAAPYQYVWAFARVVFIAYRKKDEDKDDH